MSKKFLKLCIAFSFLSATGFASAQDVVTPKADLPLRDAPPGVFQSKGDQIGTVRQDQELTIIEQRTVPTITGSENWIKVKPNEGIGKSGWIYSGSGKDPNANVSPQMGR